MSHCVHILHKRGKRGSTHFLIEVGGIQAFRTCFQCTHAVFFSTQKPGHPDGLWSKVEATHIGCIQLLGKLSISYSRHGEHRSVSQPWPYSWSSGLKPHLCCTALWARDWKWGICERGVGSVTYRMLAWAQPWMVWQGRLSNQEQDRSQHGYHKPTF